MADTSEAKSTGDPSASSGPKKITFRNLFSSDTCTFKPCDGEFLESRKLNSNAISPFLLYFVFISTPMAIGLPIMWNAAFPFGYGNLLLSTAIAYAIYAAFVLNLIELMAMLPFNGGMAVFARAAFGPYVGYFTGSCEVWEYVLVGSQSLVLFGTICQGIFNTDPSLDYLYWIPAVIIVLGISWCGARVYAITQAATISIEIIGHLVLFFATLKGFNLTENAVLNTASVLEPNTTSPITTAEYMFPYGSTQIWPCITLLTYSVMGLEASPLYADESKNFTHSPKMMLTVLVVMYTIMISLLIVVPGFTPGIISQASSFDVILDPFLATYNLDGFFDGGIVARVLYAVVFLPGILNSILASVYNSSRQIYALSKVGYYPIICSHVSTRTRAPMMAVCIATAAMVVVAALVYAENGGLFGIILSNSVTLYSLFAFLAVNFAYIKMRTSFPQLKRPFDLGYPFGMICAMGSIVGFVSILIQLFTEEIMRLTLILCIGKLLAMMLEFVFYHRFRLIETPEEAFIQKYMKTLESGDEANAELQDADGKIDAHKFVHQISQSKLSAYKRKSSVGSVEKADGFVVPGAKIPDLEVMKEEEGEDVSK